MILMLKSIVAPDLKLRRRKMKYSINKNKYLLENEYTHLQNLLIEYKKRSPRDYMILQVALQTGARAQEILNITRADLNPNDKSIFIRGLKGSNDRELPVKPMLFNELYSFSSGINSDAKIFSICYFRLRQIWNEFRPCNKTFHALRHTFALRLYKKTKDVKLVQMALGHASISSSMVYMDFFYSQTELRKLLL